MNSIRVLIEAFICSSDRDVEVVRGEFRHLCCSHLPTKCPGASVRDQQNEAADRAASFSPAGFVWAACLFVGEVEEGRWSDKLWWKKGEEECHCTSLPSPSFSLPPCDCKFCESALIEWGRMEDACHDRNTGRRLITMSIIFYGSAPVWMDYGLWVLSCMPRSVSVTGTMLFNASGH